MWYSAITLEPANLKYYAGHLNCGPEDGAQRAKVLAHVSGQAIQVWQCFVNEMVPTGAVVDEEMRFEIDGLAPKGVLAKDLIFPHSLSHLASGKRLTEHFERTWSF